jgi:hypothetical protein
MIGVEVHEEIRSYLGAELVNVTCRIRWVERFSVDQFEGPSPHS